MCAVTRICCGCSLRLGAICVGWFYFITNLLTCVHLYFLRYFDNKGELNIADYSYEELMRMSITAIIFNFIYSVALIVAAYKRLPTVLLVWTVFKIFVLIVCELSSSISIIIFLALGKLDSNHRDLRIWAIAILIENVVLMVLSIYFLMVVDSYRRQLDDEKREDMNNKLVFDMQQLQKNPYTNQQGFLQNPIYSQQHQQWFYPTYYPNQQIPFYSQFQYPPQMIGNNFTGQSLATPEIEKDLPSKLDTSSIPTTEKDVVSPISENSSTLKTENHILPSTLENSASLKTEKDVLPSIPENSSTLKTGKDVLPSTSENSSTLKTEKDVLPSTSGTSSQTHLNY